ncbi:MAG: zinc-dependent peptidase [Deltaproteobacteria bacterium]|nr:zinc-dependent peptidase [Deltaproteobacteria bacterium]
MFDLTDTCNGFFFRCYVPDGAGLPIEVDDAPGFAEAEEAFIARVQEVLRGRPDLLELLSCLENGLEVRLHCGSGFVDEENETYFFGSVQSDGEQLVLEISTEEVLLGARAGHEALDVVVHELTHVLDHMQEPTGMLPFMEREEQREFVRLRARELEKLADGASCLDPYALTNDMEFLAVAVETFFARPYELATTSPKLFQSIDRYFQVDPQEDAITMAAVRPVASAATQAASAVTQMGPALTETASAVTQVGPALTETASAITLVGPIVAPIPEK